MHRTTVEFDDKTLQNLRAICRNQKKTFKKVVLDVVRKGLEKEKATPPPKKNPMDRWIVSSNPLPPGIDPSDRSTYWHLISRPLP